MKLKIIMVVLVLAAMGGAAGCTHFQQTLIGEEKTFPATKAENVEVFLTHANPQRAFQEISYIVVEEGSEKKAVEFLKKKAASVGADALVDCSVRVRTYVILFIFIPIPINAYHVSGVAVKYTN